MPTFTRNLRLTIEAGCDNEADGVVNQIASAIHES